MLCIQRSSCHSSHAPLLALELKIQIRTHRHDTLARRILTLSDSARSNLYSVTFTQIRFCHNRFRAQQASDVSAVRSQATKVHLLTFRVAKTCREYDVLKLLVSWPLRSRAEMDKID